MAETDLEAAPPLKPKRKGKRALPQRGDDLTGRDGVMEQLEKKFEHVENGFRAQRERADNIMDYWDAYECKLGRQQNYSGGMRQLFVPIIRNAVNALATRFINQTFPQSSRHVEAISGEQDLPYALVSLVEHYIEKAKLRTQSVRALLVNGQVEGQYNAYVNWKSVTRHVVSRETKPLEQDGLQFPELGEVEETTETVVEDACPTLEALHDNDVLVEPATAESVDDALEQGGSVTVVRRWSKAKIEGMIDDEDILEAEGEELLESMGGQFPGGDTSKHLAAAAGQDISKKGSAVCYETWTKLKLGKRRRLCRVYYGPDKSVLGAKLNPFWNDRCPVLSGAVNKTPGVFKGRPPVADCMDMQIQANDSVNEAGDMMYYTLASIIAVDPEKVSKWKELVADVAAVWPVNPDGVKVFEFPNKAQEALQIVAFNKAQIFETLGVNPSMLPQQTGAKSGKRNQAEIAMEQQVDLLTTADAVTVLEGEILTPTVAWFADLDHQFRDEEILVREFGELGMKAGMERIEAPVQQGNRYTLRWSGVEAARNAANIQQQIGLIGTVMKVPPQSYMGYRLNLAPALEAAFGSVFPARLARLTFVSMKDEMSVDPKVENDMLTQGFEVMTHAADNDAEHLQVHMASPAAKTQSGRLHIQMHQAAMKMKQAAMAAQGAPGQGGAGPGPRPGAQPAMGPRAPQQPAGAIRPDNMARAGAPGMPRKT